MHRGRRPVVALIGAAGSARRHALFLRAAEPAGPAPQTVK